MKLQLIGATQKRRPELRAALVSAAMPQVLPAFSDCLTWWLFW
ncbi:hypothetical protein PMI40_02764 [Herbaspirillum sp. YR522]|nr:hypothetical protein PMI40_02764 [Herbaspirillum sp. YR522]